MGRMHRDYLKEHDPIQYNCLRLSGELWTSLADLNEQALERLGRIIDQAYEQHPCQNRGNDPGGDDLCMNTF